jgi:protein O-GlcNAc transferase
MGTSHSVITALQSVLKQREIKVSTRTLETFLREVDRVAPWYACSGSLTLSSWEKLKGDLVKEQQNGKLKAGTMPLWKLVRSCLEAERCRPAIITGQAILEEVQDSMAETEWCERLRALKKENVHKEKSPSRDLESEEVKNLRINPQGEKKEKEKVQKKKSLYPVKELEALKLDSLKADELSSFEEEELEYEAAHYKIERYHPDERRVKKSEKKLKVTGDTEQATSRPSSVNTPPSYVKKFYSDYFLSKEEKKKLYQAFPVFEAANGGRVHAPVEYIQIKELAESVHNYGVSANFTISHIEKIATLAMTPGDWQITVKAALPNMGQYME